MRRDEVDELFLSMRIVWAIDVDRDWEFLHLGMKEVYMLLDVFSERVSSKGGNRDVFCKDRVKAVSFSLSTVHYDHILQYRMRSMFQRQT